MDASSQTTITPHNQQPLVTRNYPSQSELDDIIVRASVAQRAWARVPLNDRLAIGTKFLVCTLRP
jgi:acyl-CoA reductase-like NAD-dependent aldehyde dehydrogenase